MSRTLTIAGRRIADDTPCYVIAELGHNHGGSVAVACDLIRAASLSGAEAVKLQKRDNARLYSPAVLDAPYAHEHSYGPTYGAHRAALEFSSVDYQACDAQARVSAVTLFATAFDEVSADLLFACGAPAIKIASGGLTDRALLTHVGSLGLPVVLSTGGGTLDDVLRAVGWIGHDQVAVLHCTAAYPVRDFAELNLRCIETFRRELPHLVIGWSGHDSGIAMAMAAYTLGARIIEKHFTLNRANKGTDHAFSLEPDGLRKLCRDLRRAHVALGDGVKRYYPSEVAPIAKMRRRETPDGWQITGVQDVL